MTDSHRYFAFISYSHVDERWGRWAHKAIESYRVPARLVRHGQVGEELPKRLFPVFRDRDELASAPELGHEIEAALRDARNLIVVCSPASANSRWVNEEVRYFKSLGRADRVFCLIVDGEPGDAERECFPPAIRFLVADDGALTDHPAEPVAADARPDGDGRANARLKLIAGMLGVGFDQLKQRELAARNRRLTIIAGGAAMIAAVTVGLSVFAFQQQALAEQRRHQAEDLVTYMVTDLSDSLVGVGRIDLMKAVSGRVQAYLDSLSESEKTRDIRLFEIQSGLARDENTEVGASANEALERLDEAVKATQALLDQAADDGGFGTLAQVHMYRALKGLDLQDSRLVLEASNAGLGALAQVQEPETYLSTRSQLLETKARALRDIAEEDKTTQAEAMPEVEALLLEAISIEQSLIDRNPLNVTAMLRRANARRVLADSRKRLVGYSGGQSDRDIESAIAAYAALLEVEPTHAEALNTLGLTLLLRSTQRARNWDATGALEDAAESRRIQDRLFTLEPRNRQYQAYRAYAITAQSVGSYLTNRLDQAYKIAEEGAEFLGQLSAEDPSHIGIWGEWITSLAGCAEMNMAAGRLDAAADCVELANSEIQQRLAAGTTLNAHANRMVTWALALTAEVYRASDGRRGADVAEQLRDRTGVNADGSNLDALAAKPTIELLRWLVVAERDQEAADVVDAVWTPGSGVFARHRLVRSACERKWLIKPETCATAMTYPRDPA